MKAVKAELMAGQQIVADRIMQSRCARPLVRATNTTVVCQGLNLQGSAGEGVDRHHHGRSREEASSFVMPEEEADGEKGAAAAAAAAAGEKSAIETLRERHRIPECYVKVAKLKMPRWAVERAMERLKQMEKKKERPEGHASDPLANLDDDDLQLMHPELRTCIVSLRDLKCHTWWGPRVREYLANWRQSSRRKSSGDAQRQKRRHPSEEVLDLTGLKEKVEAQRYGSVLAFHLAFRKVCETVHVRGPSGRSTRARVRRDYVESMREVFPWFDAARPTAFFEPRDEEEAACAPPSEDHLYSDHRLRRVDLYREDGEQDGEPPAWKQQDCRNAALFLDVRRCVLCQHKRDAVSEGPGRLIYFRQDEWVHVNCALWSSEVYEEVDGSLQNVPQAVTRGARLNCTFCDGKGATVGCCQAGCDANYHFYCGVADGAVYFEDKTVYCDDHAWRHSHRPVTTDFSVWRTVHVDLEENRRRVKKVDLRTVKVRVGGLVVERLGEISPGVSDTKEALVPIGFACSRLFWSHVDPNRVVRYFCKTRLVRPQRKRSEKSAVRDEFHLRIDHECGDVEAVSLAEKSLEEFRKRLRWLEVQRKARQDSILPPHLVGKVWKNVSYADLHRPDDMLQEDGHPVGEIDLEKDATPHLDPSTKAAAAMEAAENEAKEESNLSASQEADGSAAFLSPSKRLNKAVGNVRRTPNKSTVEQQHDHDLDLALGEDFLLEDVDHDLISGILQEGNFEEELGKTSGALGTKTTSFHESGQLHHYLSSETEAAIRKLKGERKEEVTVTKTWFNQNKMRKFSEVKLQCSLPFDVHVFDMDVDYSDLTDVRPEEDRVVVEMIEDKGGDYAQEVPEEGAPSQRDGDVSGENSDILSYVAENMEKMNQGKEVVKEGGGDMNEIDLLNKILAMSADRILEMGTEEQTIELEPDKSSEITLRFPKNSADGQQGEENAASSVRGALNEDAAVEEFDLLKKLHYHSTEQPLPQVDGADDEDDDVKVSRAKESADSVATRDAAASGLPAQGDDHSATTGESEDQARYNILNCHEASKDERKGAGEEPESVICTDDTPRLEEFQDVSEKERVGSTPRSKQMVIEETEDSGEKMSGETLTHPESVVGSDQVSALSTGVELEPQSTHAEVVLQDDGKHACKACDTDANDASGANDVSEAKDSVTDDNLPALADKQVSANGVFSSQETKQAESPNTAPPVAGGSEDGPSPTKIQKLDEGTASQPDSNAASAESSPRKDFSIAGLLSPTEKENLVEKIKSEAAKETKEDSDDDDVVVLASSSSSKTSSTVSPRSKSRMAQSPLSPRKLLPKSSISTLVSPQQQLQQQQQQQQQLQPQQAPVAQAPVFIQQFSTPEQATSFTEGFQNTTGRSLQYVTSIAQMPGATISAFPQQLQLAPGSTILQPLGSTGFLQAPQQLQLTPQGFISAVPAQQVSYVTPQGIIVNQPATPSFVSLTPGAAAPGTTLLYSSGAAAAAPTPVYLSPAASAPAPSFIPAGVPPPMSPFPPPLPASTPHSPFAVTTTTTTTTVQQQQQQQHTLMGGAAAPSPLPPSSSLISTPPKKIARVQPQPSTSKLLRPQASKPRMPGMRSTKTDSLPQHQLQQQQQMQQQMQMQSRVSDPLKALSSMASQPMATHTSSQTSSSRLSITHGQAAPSIMSREQHLPSGEINVTDLDPVPGPSAPPSDSHRSVGTQAKIGGPLKILTPRPWFGSDYHHHHHDRPTSTTSSASSRPTSHTTPLPCPSFGTVSSGVSADDNSSISRPDSIVSQEEEEEEEATPEESRASTPLDEHNYFSPASTPEAHRYNQL